jgi:ribose transport system ATP-binding protein
MPKLLELQSIGKTFPGVVALDDVSIDLLVGEVHVLIGENGAGKSTLMKILSGAYQNDSGSLSIEGVEVLKNDPKKAEQLGIRMIYQELNLIPELSVMENIFLGHELKLKGRLFLNKKSMYEKAKEILGRLNIPIDPKTQVKHLTIAARQMVEIAKALSSKAKILVFDEPTSSLTSSEIKDLFAIINSLKATNVGMFYISHRLEELFMIGDRVTVLRDGKKIATKNIGDITIDELIEKIAGREITDIYPHKKQTPGEVLLDINGLTSEKFKNITMHLRSGEIVGLSGLVGAGRSEMARAVFGIDNYKSGSITICGEKLVKKSPKIAGQKGLSYLPEDRKEQGLALPLNVRENIVIAGIDQLFPNHIINRQIESQVAASYVEELNIATPTTEKLTRFLSGGNQQKVVIAKWLLTKAKVFIFDEPTRGIDVAAKSGIYGLMDQLAKEGAAILMISSDLPEIIGMSDRVYVMSNGILAGEVREEDITQEKILELAFSQVKGELITDETA